jgi:hypothetical protein
MNKDHRCSGTTSQKRTLGNSAKDYLIDKTEQFEPKFRSKFDCLGN